MSDDAAGEEPRQRIVRSRRGRRATLTPAPGTTAEPVPGDERADDEGPDAAQSGSSGPNDERLKRDKPPHY